MKKIRVHYAFFVCLGAALSLFMVSGLAVNAFGIYQPYIMAFNGLTNSKSSFIVTCRTVSTLFAMLLSGFYYKKLSLRAGMALAGLCTFFSFVLFGFAGSYFSYCLASARAE